ERIGAMGCSASLYPEAKSYRGYLPNAQDLIVSNVIAALVFQVSAVLVAYATTGARSFQGQATSDAIMSGWMAMLFLSGTITGFTLVRLLGRAGKAENV